MLRRLYILICSLAFVLSASLSFADMQSSSSDVNTESQTTDAQQSAENTSIDMHDLRELKSYQVFEDFHKIIANLEYLQKNSQILEKLEEYSSKFAEDAFLIRRDCIEFLKKNFINSEKLLISDRSVLVEFADSEKVIEHLTTYNVQNIKELLDVVVVISPEILLIEIIRDERNFLELTEELVYELIQKIYTHVEYERFRKDWNTGTSTLDLAQKLYGEELVELLSDYFYIDDSMLTDDDFEVSLRNLFFETREVQKMTSTDQKRVDPEAFFDNAYITRNGYFEGLLIMHTSMNRVDDDDFPNDLSSVIYQKGQFTWANHKKNHNTNLDKHREKDILNVLNILVLDGFRFYSFVKSSMNFNLSSKLEKFVGICFYMKGKPKWIRSFENTISGDHHFFRNPSSNLLNY